MEPAEVAGLSLIGSDYGKAGTSALAAGTGRAISQQGINALPDSLPKRVNLLVESRLPVAESKAVNYFEFRQGKLQARHYRRLEFTLHRGWSATSPKQSLRFRIFALKRSL